MTRVVYGLVLEFRPRRETDKPLDLLVYTYERICKFGGFICFPRFDFEIPAILVYTITFLLGISKQKMDEKWKATLANVVVTKKKDLHEKRGLREVTYNDLQRSLV